MKDLIAKLQLDANCALGAIWMHIDAQAARIAELEAQIAGAFAPVVEQQPVAMATQGTQFGPGLAFLANGKDLPKPDTLLYAAALSMAPVAWAVTSDNTKGIHKLSMTRESADRKAAAWLKEWPNNPVRVRPLVFADATAPTADTSSLRDAILKLPLPNGQTEDGAFRDLSSWEREVFVRGALAMRKAAADLAASTALQAPVREVPGWISIKDQLPEDKQLVWCARFDGRVLLAKRHGNKPLATGEPWDNCYWWDQETGNNWSDVTVSAWMVVPERIRPAAPAQEPSNG